MQQNALFEKSESQTKPKMIFGMNNQKSMNLTFHKWALKVMTVLNPTQYTKFNKYNVKTPNRHKSKIPKGTANSNALFICVFHLHLKVIFIIFIIILMLLVNASYNKDIKLLWPTT